MRYLSKNYPSRRIAVAGAHVSCSGSAMKIRLRAGAADQQDRWCAVSRNKLVELEYRKPIIKG
jgi:hypothetical protein